MGCAVVKGGLDPLESIDAIRALSHSGCTLTWLVFFVEYSSAISVFVHAGGVQQPASSCDSLLTGIA